jgi:RecB family exonuclease
MTKFLSPTSINTYLRCPRKYFLKYIKGLKEKPSIHLIRGKAVHDAIAKFHKTEIQDPKDFERTKLDLLALFNHSWIAQETEIEGLGLPERTLNEYYHESAEMLFGWLKRNLEALRNGEPKPKSEVKLFSQTHGVMGIIDAIHSRNGKVSLTDYKTGKMDTLSQDIKVQMAIYALLYQENFGRLPDVIILDFLKFQRSKPFPVSDHFTHYAARLCKEIHEKTSSVNEKDYPCKCGGWCAKDFL